MIGCYYKQALGIVEPLIGFNTLVMEIRVETHSHDVMQDINNKQ